MLSISPSGTVILRALLMLTLLAALLVAAFVSGFSVIAAICLGIAFAGAFLYFFFYHIPRYVGSFEIRLGEDSLVVSRGVLIRKSTVLPRTGFLYINRLSLPLSSLFGLQALIICAAKTRVALPFLDQDAAKEIIERMCGYPP